jgi:hypothetical protein
MLALAISISLTSYDGSTTTSSNSTNVTEATSITMNTINSDVLSEVLTVKLEDRLENNGS